MSFTCPTETGITVLQLSQTYTGTGTGKQLLPSSVLPTDRTAEGVLTANALVQWVAGLERQGILPSAPSASQPASTSVAAYEAALSAFLQNARSEYCFYESRYKAALQYLFQAIRDAAQQPTEEKKQVVTTRLQATQMLNQKVNDLVMILNAITEKRMTTSSALQSEIQRLNSQLSQKRDRLQEQNKMIRSNESAMQLHKQMVKYTEEKAAYSDNLLKMYSFLNIVALGLLVYVYKAAGDA